MSDSIAIRLADSFIRMTRERGMVDSFVSIVLEPGMVVGWFTDTFS
jgi:hypothetical protein